MTVRAKFQCTKKETVADYTSVTLNAVTSGSEENDRFFEGTPFGQLEMGTINEEAAKQFEEGQEYYIDIIRA